jgi:hypothetical protein
MAVFTAKAASVATVAMAETASNISKVTKVAHNMLERPSDPVHTSPAESLAIWPRTAKLT